MTAVLPALLVGLPVLAAAVVALVDRARVAVSVVATAVVLAAAVAATVVVADGSRIVLGVGGHDAGLGIVLVVDLLAAVAATVCSAVVLASQVALTGTAADRWPVTRPALLLLTAGVLLSFVTGDLFTLFVSFEVLLLASYVLLTRDGDRDGVRAAPAYVGANLVGSAVFLLAIAGVYGSTGTVNLAAVAETWPSVDESTRVLVGAALLVVFATKAALVPWGVWLPRTYGALPPVIGAAVAALLTKVGVVALVRVGGLLELTAPGGTTRTALLAIACVTMIGGVVVALGQQEVHRILAAHVVSQVGFMVAGLALLDVAGTAAGILYLVHHVLVKGALLLVAGAIVARTGTLLLRELGGVRSQAPVVSALFVLGGATLAGLPPTSGFVAKVAVLQATVDQGLWWVVASMAVGSVLTLVSMLKIHDAMSAEVPGAIADRAAVGATTAPTLAVRSATAAAGGLLAAGLGLSLFAGPAHDLVVVAAETLLDHEDYSAAVLP